jgi:hypothetical protein
VLKCAGAHPNCLPPPRSLAVGDAPTSPKWVHNTLQDARDLVGDPVDTRRTRSDFEENPIALTATELFPSRHIFFDKQNKWFQWLHLVEWWYNSTNQTLAKMTPFQALYGYENPSWKDLAMSHIKVTSVKDHLDRRKKILQLIKDNLTVARNRMKQQADQNRTER